jgi:PAS domain S-box-containing protein
MEEKNIMLETNGVAPSALPRPGSAPRTLREKAQPTGRAVPFGLEEIIVSKTDLRGRITYANGVFLRVSGYHESEVVGQPHSMIRHPAMPRCIFELLWRSIQAGKEIFAYVVNMAKNGDHYWVLAHVTPTFDERGAITGYHSNRRCPDPHQVDAVEALYRRLTAEERRHTTKSEAIAASLRLLEQIVAETHASYDEFVFAL